jgi:hypothetical protein
MIQENGAFIVGQTSLNPSLNIEKFMSLPLAQEVANTDKVNSAPENHTYFLLRPQLGDGFYYILNLGFNPMGNLFRILLSISNDDQLPSWETWSEEKERQIRAENDRYLFRHLGKPHRFGAHGEVIYEYNWGEVVSSYDPRSAQSNIIIVYYQESDRGADIRVEENKKTLPMWESLLIVGVISLGVLAVLILAFWSLLR